MRLSVRQMLMSAAVCVAIVVTGPAVAWARAQYPGLYIGCQNWRIYGGQEALRPQIAPRNCVLPVRNDFDAKFYPLGDTYRIDGVHWSGWGHNTVYGTGRGAPADSGSAFRHPRVSIVAYDLVHTDFGEDCGYPSPSYYGKVVVRSGSHVMTFVDKPDFEC
jgi:hypothetical protein